MAPIAGPSRLPATEPPLIKLRDAGNGTYIEDYPIITAGAPIGNACKKKGSLAELLGLKGTNKAPERPVVQTMEGEGKESVAKQCGSSAGHQQFTAGTKMDDNKVDWRKAL
ncbi:hypothetical protein RhiXN_04641 [Rhizoctonia solani]|uniref:Uncharacterized protein n=1 Tax=Rhizoctonia solani TaxID=456999 RepID=A0A8H8NNX8_9AGAM|nr:uncharacterized protein RhiXN_04641 [Rhizoctonia solani]QRW16640.1 hypothetical protein RhiXN_04641 [Rhizoctonia solani]